VSIIQIFEFDAFFTPPFTAAAGWQVLFALAYDDTLLSWTPTGAILRKNLHPFSATLNTLISGFDVHGNGIWDTTALGYAVWDPICIDAGNVASATTTDLSATAGNSLTITGANTITAITLTDGMVRFVRLSGALALTNGASLVLPGGQNITTVAGDFAIFIAGNSNVVYCVAYQKINTVGVVTKYSSGGFGYLTGAGGTVTQNTNKSTGVTLNTNCGQITMNNAALASLAIVGFTLSNTAIAAKDFVDVQIASGATANSYRVFVDASVANSCHIQVTNISGGSLSEAIVLNFTVIKGVIA
jgi:hypothetical protein